MVPFVNGQEHGTEMWWYKGGQKKIETPWVQGQEHGTEAWWNQDGSLWSIHKWHQGEMLVSFEFDGLNVPKDAKVKVNLLTGEYKVL